MHETRRLNVVGSTNDEARAWARDGAAHLSLVTAREQSGGRGRRGRSWASPAGLGFYGSLIVRPGASAIQGDAALCLARWTLGAAVGVARAVDGLLGGDLPPARVKWPNDVLLRGKKLAGVLCEAEWQGSCPSFLIVGVGLNVAHGRDDLPERPLFPASSLLLESGRRFDHEQVEEAVAQSLREVCDSIEDGHWDSVRAHWEERCQGRGELISVAQEGQRFFGVLRGLDADGALVVAAEGGARRVVAGDIVFE